MKNNSTLKIGTKVQLSRQYAEWVLNNVEAYYQYDGKIDKDAENHIKLAMLRILGQPVYGTVDGYSHTTYGVYRVSFNVDNMKAWAYYRVSRKDNKIVI